MGRHPRQTLARLLLFLLPMIAAACGTFEATIERTATVDVIAIATQASQVSTPTLAVPATPTSVPSMTVTPTPWVPSDAVIEQEYTNPFYKISLTFPGEWEIVPGYSEYGDRFAGSNGFFMVGAAGGGTIDEITLSEADHRLQPYGPDPTIEMAQVAGQPARFIWPSDDATMEYQSALIVQYPQPVTISGSSYDHFILYADQTHLRSLAQTLRFTTLASETDSQANIWSAAGTPPDTLVALIMPSTDSPPRFGDIATMHADGTALNKITTYNYNVDPVLSPDGQRIAYRSVPISISSLPDPGPRLYEGLYNIWVITIDGSQAWQLTQSEEIRSIPTWSADSRRVAFSQGAEAVLIEVEVDTQTSRQIISGAFAPRYRPDGSGIAYITPDGGLDFMEDGLGIHTLVPAITLPPNTVVNDFDWFPDSHHLIYTLADDSDRQIEELNVGVRYSSWTVSLIGPDPLLVAEGVHDVDVSPDGKIIAALRGSGYGDACMVDSELLFLSIAPDLGSSETITLTAFEGYPATGPDQSFYPLPPISWVSQRLAIAQLGMTCAFDSSAPGHYILDPVGRRMMQVTDVGPD